MTSDKKNISVRIEAPVMISMKAWKVLGSMHANILLEYDESDFLEYALHRTLTDQETRGRYIAQMKNLTRSRVMSEDNNTIFAGTSLSVTPFDVPKTFRIPIYTYAALEDLLKDSSGRGISSVVNSLLSATMNNSKELVRFLIRNSLATRCMGTSLSYYSKKTTPLDIKGYIVEGTVPRVKNTPFENNAIKKFVTYIQSLVSREQLQLEMLKSKAPIQSGVAYASASQEIMKIKEEDFLPYQRNDLFFPVVAIQHIGQYLVQLNEILHIHSTLDRLASNFFHPSTIFPLMVEKFYDIGKDGLVSNVEEVITLLNKKFDDFRGMLNSEAESLLSLIT